MSARLYLDSMESLKLGMKLEQRSGSNRATLNRTDPVVLLKVAAVVNGLKVTKKESTPCDMWVVAEGSVMDTRKFIAALLFSVLLIGATVFAIVFAIYAEKTCSVRIDPLDPLWPVQHLLHSGQGAFTSVGLKPPLQAHRGVSNNARSMLSTERLPPPQPANDDDLPPVAHMELPEQISFRSPVSFPPAGSTDGSRSITARCFPHRIRLRSPIVRTPGTSYDDFWIGIHEDAEEKIGRFMPHRSADFESLKLYPKQIQ